MSEYVFTTEDIEDTEVKSFRFSGLNLLVRRSSVVGSVLLRRGTWRMHVSLGRSAVDDRFT
jgi:hypothetical protein